MKIFSRIIALILVMFMLAFAVACNLTGNNGKDTSNPNGTSGQSGDTNDPNYDDKGYWKDDLPNDLNYEDTTIKVLNWNAERDEFFVEKDTGDTVVSAIFNRNAQVEQRLNVKLDFTLQDGNVSNMANFVTFVEKQNQSGDFYNIIATYSRTAGTLSTKGYFVDLNQVDDSYINLEQPWYPQTLISTLAVNDKLHFVSGDMSTNVLHFMYSVYFNKKLFADEGIENPYNLVREQKWTIEKMMNLKTDYYQDLDSDGKMSLGDRYTFTSIYYNLDALYTGSGLRLLQQSNEQNLIISPDFTSEKAIDLVAKLGPWLVTKDCLVSGGPLGTLAYQDPFKNGTALMCLNRVYMAENHLREVEWKYGVVPVPKYDEAQSDYITVVGNPFTLYGIMNGSEEITQTTAVLECWSSEGYRRTTPAVFETNMQSKFSDTEDDSEMFGIIHDTITFDLGRIFYSELNKISEMPSHYMAKNQVWNSTAGGAIRVLETNIKKISDMYNK
jgi:hypothetical protein